jgi:hypothetical protein
MSDPIIEKHMKELREKLYSDDPALGPPVKFFRDEEDPEREKALLSIARAMAKTKPESPKPSIKKKTLAN